MADRDEKANRGDSPGIARESALTREVEKWLTQLEKRNRTPATCAAYERDLNLFIDRLGQISGRRIGLHELRLAEKAALRHVMAEIHRDGFSPNTVRRIVTAVRSFARHLAANDILANPEVWRIAFGERDHPTPSNLTDQDVAEMIDTAKVIPAVRWIGYRDAAFLTLMSSTGVTAGEGLALNGRDIQGSSELRVLGIRSGTRRTLPLSSNVQHALQQYIYRCPYRIAKSTPLFFGQRGDRLRPRVIQVAVRRICEHLNLPRSVTAETLRRFLAVDLYRQGHDIGLISRILGHTTLAATRRMLGAEIVEARETDVETVRRILEGFSARRKRT